MSPADLALLHAIRTPTVDSLTAGLVDIGDGLAAAFATLQRDPLPDAAELLAIRLDGARRHVLQLAEGIRREDTE